MQAGLSMEDKLLQLLAESKNWAVATAVAIAIAWRALWKGKRDVRQDAAEARQASADALIEAKYQAIIARLEADIERREVRHVAELSALRTRIEAMENVAAENAKLRARIALFATDDQK